MKPATFVSAPVMNAIVRCLCGIAMATWIPPVGVHSQPQGVAAQSDTVVAAFIAAKRSQAEQAATHFSRKVPQELWKFFDAATAGNWRSASNLFEKIQSLYMDKRNTLPLDRLPAGVWHPVCEVLGFLEVQAESSGKFLRVFGDEIFKVVPSGSIYFGGTDPGRFVIAALSQSHGDGRPFFTLTQNQLVDSSYLEYLDSMYGGKLKLPDATGIQRAFEAYLSEAQRRWKHDQDFPNEPRQIKAGEELKMVGGHLQASGRTAVIAVNALLAKHVFDANPGREFYLEESFPFEWMYPHLLPVGPIFKINRRPLDAIPEEVVLNDRGYWNDFVRRVLGLTMFDAMSIDELCEQATKLHLRKDLSGFAGDTALRHDASAQKTFSKLRSAIAATYAWRMTNATSATDRRRMVREADFAFKQSILLSPTSPEAVWGYAHLLVETDRHEEAKRLANSSLKFDPKNTQVSELVKWVDQAIEWKKRTTLQ